tara:strand:+ start:2021 stop:2197 length:177 start_codon:yes stop_codon:yes gene_type:complete
MYNFDKYDNQLRDFELVVTTAVNMEISNKISSEEAYQRIKSGYAILKKFRKKEKKNTI